MKMKKLTGSKSLGQPEECFSLAEAENFLHFDTKKQAM
jgi:hypothetical protein